MSFIEQLKKIDLKNTKVQIALLIVIVGILGGGAYYQFVLVNKKQDIKRLSDELNKKQNELNNIRAMKPRLTELRGGVDRLNQELDSLRAIFPDQKEIPQLIQNITEVARKSGVYTMKFNPLRDDEKEYYIENKYLMLVVGGYHELATFFNYLANFDLMINLSRVSIKRNPTIDHSIMKAKEHGGPIQTIVASFNLTTFSSK